MLRIGICDDDHKQIEQVHAWIDEELFQRTELRISYFNSGEEVIAAIEKEEFDVQLLIMDIHMEKIDGMETAAYIRQHRIDVDIIFLTVSKEYVYNGYMHKAYAYLLKPIDERTFKRMMNQYVDEWEHSSGYLEVKTAGGLQKIWLNKVLYFTSDVRIIDAHMVNGNIRFYGKLDEVEQQIEEGNFIRCHQSFLVNKTMIDKLSRAYLLVRGERIPVSRSRYEQMKQKGVFEKEAGSCPKNTSVLNKWADAGAVIGISGKYTGAIIRIKPDTKIVFGRNHELADFVLDEPTVSRKHCWIQYDCTSRKYYVCDMSVNGVFVNGLNYLEKNCVVELNPEDELRFADTDNIFKLG